MTIYNGSSMAQTLLRYPLKLSGKNESSVVFTGFDDTGPVQDAKIALYMPSNFSVADGASYNNFDLGVLGQEASALATKMFAGEEVDASTLASAKVSGDMKNIINSQILSDFGMGSGVVDKGRDLALLDMNKAINPNTTLQYGNSTIRGYNFAFKMVAQSQNEANTIRDIVSTFRKYMYGEKGGLNSKTLSYPLKWKLLFLAPDGKVNEYLPNAYECYLESLTATYNSTGNSFHYDGSPIEVDVNVAFKETKALAREDIEALSISPFRNNL